MVYVYTNMSTPAGHIIIHKHAINEMIYIRIAVAAKTDDYFKELKIAYDQDASSTDDNVHVIYNCGDMYERLLHDIKYKKFKDVELEYVCNDMSLALVKSGINDEWFKDVYVQWIESKIAFYFADMDEDTYLQPDPEAIDWTAIQDAEYVVPQVTAGEKCYLLKHYEVSHDGKIVLSREHVLAAIITRESGRIIPSVDENLDLTAGVHSSIHRRSIYIDKDALTSTDLTSLIYSCFPPEFVIKAITSTSIRCIINACETESLVPYEWNVHQKWYSFIENDAIMLTSCSLSEVYELPYCSPITQRKTHLQNETEPDSASVNTVIYRNIVNGVMYTLASELKHLKEFTKLSDFAYRTNEMSNVLASLQHSKIPIDFLDELKRFISILEDDEHIEDPAALQRELTAVYVDQHKNDNLSTVANVVVENIYKYLVTMMKDPSVVNKNQIGKDLVDLGVKKSRRAKGYVYGIEDTSVMPAKEPSVSVYPDRLKASREVRGLRSYPPIPSDNIDQANIWCKPGKYMKISTMNEVVAPRDLIMPG